MVAKTIKEKRHIVIGVDANYLHKALIFYRSLSLHHKSFVLYVFCFDDIVYDVLKEINYSNVILYSTSDFETSEILQLKKTKDRLYEYYWAINPHMGRKVILEQKCDAIGLADCDLMFFQSPEVIFEEFEGADVAIQPNNYSYIYETDASKYGYYCTSFQCFRNNDNGRAILKEWYDKCIAWCSHIGEKGKFGDQMYLDEWRNTHKNVREIGNIGTNVAPWNIQKYDLSLKNNIVMINNKWPLVYYHFHSLKMNLVDYSYIITGDRNLNYPISKDVVDLVYEPYVKLLKEAIVDLKRYKVYRDYVNQNPQGNYHLQKPETGEKFYVK